MSAWNNHGKGYVNPRPGFLPWTAFFFMLCLFPLLPACALRPAWNLHEAAGRGDTEKVVHFLDSGADVNEKSVGVTPLLDALRNRHVETAKVLVRRGADVNYVDDIYRIPPIVYAAMYGDTELTRLLIEKGANVNATTGNGYAAKAGFTALIEAAYRGDVDVGRLLLEHGADPDAEAPGGTSAMSNAKHRGHAQFVTLLKRYVTVPEPAAKKQEASASAPAAQPGKLVWTEEGLAFEVAEKKGSAAAYQAYLDEYPDGKFVALARQRVRNEPLFQACMQLDRSRVSQLLGGGGSLRDSDRASRALLAILQQANTQVVTISGKRISNASAIPAREKRKSLDTFKLLLLAGANPGAVRIKGYEKAEKKLLEGGFVLQSAGNPGTIVPASEGGLSALEFVRLNAMQEFEDALTSGQNR